MGSGRYVPQPYGVNGEFQAASVAAGQLCLQRCDACERIQHPPRERCASCGGAAYSFPPASGRGTCHSFTVSHRTADRGWADAVPFSTVVVELPEGPRVIAAWRPGAERRPSIGAPLRVTVEPVDGVLAFLWAEEGE